MGGMATLRDLGLSEYESRVYRALLSAGPATAKELSRRSEVPMGRIYDVLNALEAADMIRSQQSSRPKKYAPVEPETALSRLLEEKRESLEAELDRYEAVAGELAERLEASDVEDGEFYTVAIGPEETVELLLERLAAATTQIDMVVSTLSPQFDLDAVGARVAEALEDAVERGVDVSVLADGRIVEAVPADVVERYRAIADYDRFALRMAEGLTGTVNLIDRTEVCVGVANPLAPEEALALIALRDPAFAANLHEEFRPRWEAAAPLRLGESAT